MCIPTGRYILLNSTITMTTISGYSRNLNKTAVIFIPLNRWKTAFRGDINTSNCFMAGFSLYIVQK